ncbi:hypothetical protein Drorol1_Dr00026234 [Drosera rotundifolia]
MEETVEATIQDGEIVGISFGLASAHQVSKASISECSISHATQLGNPFLGLPLEFGKCESCGTAEPGNCEGHFGYIELPVPVYHPSHIIELKRLLSQLCLKCLKLKSHKLSLKSGGVLESLLAPCCPETAHVSIKENKTADGAVYLELKLPTRWTKMKASGGAWNFLERYGYRYGDSLSRTLLPSEVSVILKRLPEETRKKLVKKGYFPQDGYVLHYLPVPPNCLTVPDISDGVVVMSSDLSTVMLRKVLKQIENIKSSRSGEPNFESHEVEANELQVAIVQYLQFRGAGKASRDMAKQFGYSKEVSDSSTKAWLEKMRTLFISKGSGFSSRSVITGDAYKRVNEIGIPAEVAHKITFEERVNSHNINYLQSLVDKNLCLTFKDGRSTYSLREGSKGHTFLKSGQVVHRRIMDGDIVFVNRPPTTHKHSLQALSVYIHDDSIVKINPLMCSPLAADFDGDCVHLFYPQSLSARAEVMELFSVEKQLLSSHTGNLNLQLATDALLSLKMMLQVHFLDKSWAQQLAMFASAPLPPAAVRKSFLFGPRWTALQVLQTALPSDLDCSGDRYLIRRSDIVSIDFNRDAMSSVINDIVASIFFIKGPKEALSFFDSLQPLLMENIYAEGFSVGLKDFYIPSAFVHNIQMQIQDIAPLLFQLRSTYNELVELQMEKYIRLLKVPVVNFILKSSALGFLIDSKSDSGINKIVQQIGFLGLQLFDKGKFYSRSLVDDVSVLFQRKYPHGSEYPAEEFGLVKSSFIHGLDPYEAIVHSIATREVIIRSSRGLAEPGTLFKNLMAILRDVAICYDGTVRNISSNSIIQFDYGFNVGKSQSLFPAGEPVGVLAATAMSNPAYKAVLDSSPSSNSSWDMMKEILFCRVNFRNDILDRRVILYLNDCPCGGKYCRERASCLVKNLLKKVSLRDAAVEFLIEYRGPADVSESSELGTGLVGHIHLNKALLNDWNIDMHDVLEKCQDEISLFRKKKNFGYHFKKILLSNSECCGFQHGSKWSDMPCLKFFWQDVTDNHLEKVSHVMADVICPVLLDTIIKGDPRISAVNVIWVSPESTTWIRGASDSHKGELAVEVVLEKTAVRQSGDAWRIVLDCCLPVFHLIDTSRSIPHAIKQIQDLLGISCAFDQAVQRLSTSVTMVAKGVLKEHLILLASSMTCTGNLIGFNIGGIKALCRALGVQVPFTEATLYTPRKCFERAAEKCHTDSLKSIVASCSWGKRVAVGTGAKFDVLWDTRETSKLQGGIDVYNFLQLVRGASGEELGTGCLGEDVDDFELEDEFLEKGWSPEQEPKAVFEDGVDIELGAGWDGAPSSNSQDGSQWNSAKPSQSSGGWGSAANGDRDENTKESSAPWGDATAKESSGAWGNATAKESSGAWGNTNAKESSGGWGNVTTNEAAREGSIGWSSKANSSQSDSQHDGSSWNNHNKPAKAWDSSSGQQSQRNSTWGKTIDGAGNKTSEEWTSLGDNSQPESAMTSWKPNSDSGMNWESAKLDKAASTPGWGSSMTGDESKKESKSPWGKKRSREEDADYTPGLGSSMANDTNIESPGWGKKGSYVSSGETAPGWGSSVAGGETNKESESPWGKKRMHVDVADDTPGWGSGKANETNKESISSPWGNKGIQETSVEDAPGWGSNMAGDGSKVESKSVWGKPRIEEANADNSGANQSWGQSSWKSNGGERKQAWDSRDSSQEGGEGGESQKSQWGQSQGSTWRKNRPEGANTGGEWRSKNRPPNSPRTPRENFVPAPITATRQRLDLFTAEEQEVLSEIEQIMLSLRRIMHRIGYNDGDPLPAEDQSYILDNVFAHHPDKEAKTGAGIDYFMVAKHHNFQDSRCLYVVTTDGQKEDFSYRKCLENLVRTKYPDVAESFLMKYFKRRPPREQGGDQDRNSQNSPGWNREQGDQDRNTQNSPGWNRDQGDQDRSTPSSPGFGREPGDQDKN